ncbi:hypothetical protein [Halobiforma nitratireducens]|uniref:Uncharacterized protein n=1 Tax=Halobiforma nitratireducens JCM 10879 TaxID=1227454 RepID=M0LRC8_9EURY|nr:hypothetical protein [Halobiforma nitratireducens]EMA35653.1 hypothetical protein C446_12042 [Halobiforma nitratireducens JCM 10879]
MDRRYAIVGAVALLALAAGGLLALYTPTAATASSPAEQSELDGSFAVSESITVDESQFVSRESIVDASTDEQRLLISFETVTYDHYWTGDDRQYTQITAASEQELADRLAESGDELRYEYDDEPSAIVESTAGENATGPANHTFPDTLTHSQLEMTAFEATGTTSADGTTLDVHEPRTGWTVVDAGDDDGDRLYVADADGEVRVDDGQLRHANVTLERVDAETWGGYLLERGETSTIRYEYDVTESHEDEDEDEAVQPDWIEKVQ